MQEKIVYHIIRIKRASYPALERLFQAGQLCRAGQQLQHDRFNGTLYRPACTGTAQQSPLSDSLYKLGEQTIEAELHRLPSAEYIALMNRPGVEIPADLNTLSRALRGTGNASQARQLIHRFQPRDGDAPLPLQLVCPTRFQAAWQPHQTLLARKKTEWFLVLFFNLVVSDLDRQLMRDDIALDIGQSPLLTAYVINADRDIRVNSPVPLHLYRLTYELTGEDRRLMERILHAWHRARLEKFLDYLTLTCRQIFVEELSYKHLDPAFLQAAREHGIIDWHES